VKIRGRITVFILVSFFLYLTPIAALFLVGGTIARLYRTETSIAKTESSMFGLNNIVRSLLVTSGYTVENLSDKVSSAREEFDHRLSELETHLAAQRTSVTFPESLAITRRLWLRSEANVQEIERILSDMAKSGIDLRRTSDLSLMEYNSLLTTANVGRNQDHYYFIKALNLIDSVIIESDTYSQILLEASSLVAIEIRRRIRVLTVIIALSPLVFGAGVLAFALNFSRESLARQINTLLEDVKATEKEKRIFQMRILRYQINPHFLFNTLNSVRYTSLKEGAQETAEMTRILSRLLRNTISSDEPVTTVETEIRNLMDYVALMQKRFDNRLNFRIECAEVLKDLLIPPFLIQPVLENSILHGLTEIINSEKRNAELFVTFEITGKRLSITVRDNGAGIDAHTVARVLSDAPDREPHHIGLKNIHDRLILAYGPAFGLGITSTLGSGTDVVMVLPVERVTGGDP
jgi:sensor histidine kinase YesM